MLEPGERIDVWVVEQVLGSGGMGAVYRCHNYAAARILAAVKVLDTGMGAQASLRARFVREAELLFSLDHPNIVKVRNVRMDASPPFIEMAFVEGEPLDARIARGPLPEVQAVGLGVQLASALAYIHARRIAHRDLKPSNVLVRGSHVTLVDFGIAAEADGTAITHSGHHMGTLAYVPPEWGLGQPVDPYRWDLYALGLVLYECLTGEAAFPVPRDIDVRQALFAVISAKRERARLDPGPTVSAPLRALIGELTRPDPEARLGSAAEAAERLAAMLPSGTPALAPEPERGSTPVADRPRGAQPTLDVHLNESPAPAPRIAAGGAPRRVAFGVVGGLIGALGLLGLVGAVGLAALLGLPGTGGPRDLQVVLTDLPDGLPVALRSGDVIGRALEPGVYLLPALAPPTAQLAIEVGGDCAAGCIALEREVAVEPGEGPQVLRWALPKQGAGELALRAPDAPDARVGRPDEAGIALVDGVGVLEGLRPGRHAVWAQAGRCPDVAPCGEACPDGCAEERVEVDVPWTGGRQEVALTLKTPVVAPKASKAQAPREGRRPARADFAAFLQLSPAWRAEAARARGDAGSTYLRGWMDDAPPAPAAAPMTDLSWAAAAAYCSARGGLAGVDDPPTSWSDAGGAPWLEHRQRDGQPAWRRSDGVASEPGVAVSRTEANPTLGFRCRR